jgi:hypothetical protein
MHFWRAFVKLKWSVQSLAGQLFKMELLDHVIIGNSNFSSLRALGYFYQ